MPRLCKNDGEMNACCSKSCKVQMLGRWNIISHAHCVLIIKQVTNLLDSFLVKIAAT